MKLTTRGRYAVMALLEIATYDGVTPVSLAVVAERQRLSLSYLESLFTKLRQSNLVQSVRGPGGGYVLSRPAKEISVAQIIRVIDPQQAPTHTEFAEHVDGFAYFLDTHLWRCLNDQMLEYLETVSLADLLQRHASKSRPCPQMKKGMQLQPPTIPLLHVMRSISP